MKTTKTILWLIIIIAILIAAFKLVSYPETSKEQIKLKIPEKIIFEGDTLTIIDGKVVEINR